MTRKPSFSQPAAGILVAAGLAVGLGFATPALAGGKGGFHGPRVERALERLELDDTQRAEVLSVIEAARPAHRELRDQLRAALKELRAMLADPEVVEASVLAQADAIGAMSTELSKQRLSTLMQVRERLSPEQQEELVDAMKMRHGRRHGERRHVL
jgi:Spy/CpxP family protein refolding chaperone